MIWLIENIILIAEKGVLFLPVVFDEDNELIKIPPGKMIGIEIWDENNEYINALLLGGNSADNEPGGVLKDGVFPCYLQPGKYYFRIIAMGGDPEDLYSYGYVPEWYHGDPMESVTDIDNAEIFEIIESDPENYIYFHLKKYDPLQEK